MAQFKQKRRRKRNTKRVARIVAILVVFGLVAAFFIGTIGILGAQAATPSATCLQDIDADGKANAIDPDVDGDGVVNGEDDDIDGDGITNFKDQDPLGTNCTSDAPLPIKPAVVDNSTTLYIGLTAAGIAIAAPAAYFYARGRKRK